MTDLEMTKLCAEKMGYRIDEIKRTYDPLHDDVAAPQDIGREKSHAVGDGSADVSDAVPAGAAPTWDCDKHPDTKLECFGGLSAHRDNWTCPKCAADGSSDTTLKAVL
ncbi:MAG: hypothetical protein WCC12_15750, partial [Anaerolineales bacterium]